MFTKTTTGSSSLTVSSLSYIVFGGFKTEAIILNSRLSVLLSGRVTDMPRYIWRFIFAPGILLSFTVLGCLVGNQTSRQIDKELLQEKEHTTTGRSPLFRHCLCKQTNCSKWNNGSSIAWKWGLYSKV